MSEDLHCKFEVVIKLLQILLAIVEVEISVSYTKCRRTFYSLKRRHSMTRVDIAIIGTGPAGISAAITAKLRGKNVLLFGSGVSEKMEKAHLIQNYPGLPDISGKELAGALMKHLDSMNIQTTNDRIGMILSMGDYFMLQGKDINNPYEASSVILATGVVMERPLPGEEKYLGRGVSYCATCDAALYKGKRAAVIGSSEEALDEAKFLAETCSEVIFFTESSETIARINEVDIPKNLKIINEKTIEIVGDQFVSELVTRSSVIKGNEGMPSEKQDNKTKSAVDISRNAYSVDGVFILRESAPAGNLVPGLLMDEEKTHVATSLDMSTNLKGLFVCGDIAGKPYQYIKAAGQGNIAALSAVNYLLTLTKK